MADHFDVVLDLGFDFGADGGLGWDTQIVVMPNGQTRRNQRRAAALGTWQLGNRRINVAEYDQLASFFHAMRGQVHSFLYRDWNDYRAVEEPLVADGSAQTQLIKTYGAGINPWTRDIRKPDALSVVIEMDDGGGWTALAAGVDYTLEAATGLITWLIAPPTAPTELRWTGQFYVRARFDRDRFEAQFVAAEGEQIGDEALYELGSLGVAEEPE